MKILVTGATGLVGYSVIESALRRGHTVYAQHYTQSLPTRSGLYPIRLDLKDLEACGRWVLDQFPDAIVNAAAISNPAGVDADPEGSHILNVALPHRLAQIAHHLNAKFVHLSSDMVFDGQRGNYCSTDMPQPTTRYGQQKLDAEHQILEAGDYNALVLRIPIQTGNSLGQRRSIHEKLIEQWAQGKRPSLFSDEMRHPCSADNTAEVCVELCERNDLHGIFHWAGSEAISRFEMGKQILKHFGLPEDWIIEDRIALHPELANRPRDLTLETHPLKGKLKTNPQNFAEQLEYFTLPKPFREWYHALGTPNE